MSVYNYNYNINDVFNSFSQIVLPMCFSDTVYLNVVLLLLVSVKIQF